MSAEAGDGRSPVSRTHLVLIPSFNTGPRLLDTLREARRYWSPVWLVIDGSTDVSAEDAVALGQKDPGLRVLRLDRNRGKGSAVHHGSRAAAAEGFTHVLTMDADGQHPADRITDFMAASMRQPEALILGMPVFDAGAPALRVRGRRISNWLAGLQTGWCGIGDSLFGFRVYPIADLCAVMERHRWMRRFDFDPEAAVRLCWRGLRPVNIPAAVRYLRPEEGGVSHFRYGRDNLLLTGMNIRLLSGALFRLPHWVRRLASGRRLGLCEGRSQGDRP